jgi:hypothetical protein
MSETKRKPLPSWARIAIGVVVGFPLLIVGGLVASTIGSGSIPAAPPQAFMDGITRKVALDAVAQYEIAKRGPDKIQTCVSAGMVAAAYLQAKDEANYNAWKTKERDDCAAAGVPK